MATDPVCGMKVEERRAAERFSFFNAWFHGLNLAGLQSGAKPFTFGVFLYGLIGLAAGAFVTGVLLAVFADWLRALAPGQGE